MPDRNFIAAACLFVLSASAVAQPAGLTVSFIHPESYTDAAYSRSFPSEKDRAEVMRDIERHLQSLASRTLPPGDALRIEVLDVDLAGHFEPWRAPSAADLRVMRGVTWPRMQLRYTLTQGGQVVASGEERIADQNYLLTVNRYSTSDRLRYEKAMLDDWFDRRIVKRQG
ncbi:DUF3016 domain-containing protein [Variovorax sp. KK3]|uniref:DUF3016 domain-containing protein n=1 Tax=Variovorax sp. KK3 TaxID=1855728 RepID=UPI00097C1618|nr:DUF3016 domain-containing protein [Variovorax sp. KK3]